MTRPNVKTTWLTAVATELGLSDGADDAQGLDPVAALAETVAETVDPTVAGTTAYLVGVAAGRAAEPAVAAQDYAQQIDALARSWNADEERGVTPSDLPPGS